ncbi:MAG: hypothetical protein JWO62_1109 [Acidimicrobiaceae bacterium]|nr:hypothetical protein [Acidimicrobiaceae bacterium]
MSTTETQLSVADRLDGRRVHKVQGLRDLTDWLEKHPEAADSYSNYTVNLFVLDADEMAALAKSLGGKWEKHSGETWFTLARHFGPHTVEINAARAAVCERVQVGEETVEIPDPDAPKVTVAQPVYEWRCPESLLKNLDDAPAGERA